MERLTETERLEIREKYQNIKFPEPVLEPIWFGRRLDTKIEGKRAIVDQKENSVFGICSDIYQVVYYEDLIKMVEQTVEQLPEFGEIKICPHVIGNGGKIRISAKFTDVEYEIKKGDIINPKIDVYSSYDLAWKLRGVFGAFRLVCSNGLTIGKVFSTFAKRHVLSLDPSLLKDSILQGMELYSEQVELWKKWAETKMNAITYKNLWEELPFSEKEKEKIEHLQEASSKMMLSDQKWREEASVWDVHSIITQYITHEVKSEVRQAELQPVVARFFDQVYFTSD